MKYFARLALAAPLLCGLCSRASAHAGREHDVPALAWTWDALDLWPIAVSLLLLALGIGRALCSGRSGLVEPWRVASFCAGLFALFVALASPIDALAEDYFSMHMIQHLLIMLIAPPLLVLGRPLGLWLRAFPDNDRQRFARRWAAKPRWRWTLGWLLRPGVVWMAASAALWFWHMPRPYAWALSNAGVHAAEHMSFLLTNLAFWWRALDPRGPHALGGGAALLFAGTYGVENGLLGAVLTFASHPLYAPHVGHAGVMGLSALHDQQLAGVVMWVPAGIIYTLALAVMFALWLRSSDPRAGGRGMRYGLVTPPTPPTPPSV